MSASSNNPPVSDRRLTPRVIGPFEGRRRGALTVSLRIYDLSVGGCLIESLTEVSPGRRIKLDLELPYEGLITVDAETLYTRPDYGFAVKFVDLSEETRAQIVRAVERLRLLAQAEDQSA
ncbi:MAG TPA: PilZ domain-containing protein [Vicinamibacterales bacterium]|nr:PilZ domain-containing protein [Vicinamibacterales bacterium]